MVDTGYGGCQLDKIPTPQNHMARIKTVDWLEWGRLVGVDCGGHLEIHADSHNVLFLMPGSLAECRCYLCCGLLAALTCCIIGPSGSMKK